MVDFEQELEDLVRDGENLISQVRRGGGGQKSYPSNHQTGPQKTSYDNVSSNLNEIQESGAQLTQDLDKQTQQLGKIQGLLEELETQIPQNGGGTPGGGGEGGRLHERLYRQKRMMSDSNGCSTIAPADAMAMKRAARISCILLFVRISCSLRNPDEV